jgi:hypothetical protein
MQQAGKAMEDFTNAVRAELGLEAFTAEDVNRVGTTYMEVLTKQMNVYIKETREEARKFGFLEPGAVPITAIQAGDDSHAGRGQIFTLSGRLGGGVKPWGHCVVAS